MPAAKTADRRVRDSTVEVGCASSRFEGGADPTCLPLHDRRDARLGSDLVNVVPRQDVSAGLFAIDPSGAIVGLIFTDGRQLLLGD